MLRIMGKKKYVRSRKGEEYNNKDGV